MILSIQPLIAMIVEESPQVRELRLLGLGIRKRDYIQIVIDPMDKTAFDTWCLANSTTMSEIIRKEIAPYVAKGKKLMEERH